MKRDVSKDDEIEQLERRLEIRRERLRRHYDAARTDVLEKAHKVARAATKAVGWVPVAVVAGGLMVGFAASRYPRRAARAAAQPAYVYATPSQPPPARSRNLLAAMLGIGATAMRIASSNEMHTMWNAVRRFRDRRRR